jgi:hypothetical protein
MAPEPLRRCYGRAATAAPERACAPRAGRRASKASIRIVLSFLTTCPLRVTRGRPSRTTRNLEAGGASGGLQRKPPGAPLPPMSGQQQTRWMVEHAAAAAQAAARAEAAGQLSEAAAQYEVAARGLMNAMQGGSLTPAQVASFRGRAAQYMDRIDEIRSGSVLPHEPPPAPQPATQQQWVPTPVVSSASVVVVPGEFSPTAPPEAPATVHAQLVGEFVPSDSDAAIAARASAFEHSSGGAVDQTPGGSHLDEEIKLRQRRFHILQEMLTTERTFVQTLHELLEFYYEPMQHCAHGVDAAETEQTCYDVELPRSAGGGGGGGGGAQAAAAPPALSAAEFAVLFHPSLLPITRSQEGLLQELESAWAAQAQPATAIAPDFAQPFELFLPQLALYTEYIGNYKKAAALHSNLAAGAGGAARRKQLAAFEKATESKGAAPLASSLITPVQRLTRYEMLFKELLRHTAVPEEKARAERVLAGIEGANLAINEALRAHSRVAEATELLGALLHPPPPPSWLAADGVRQGMEQRSWVVAIKTHDPLDPKKIPVAIFQGGVARVAAGEILELLTTEGPAPHWWRVRRCDLDAGGGRGPLGGGAGAEEGWLLSEYTRRLHGTDVVACVEQAEGRARDWATAAHRVLSRLRNTEPAEPASSGGSQQRGTAVEVGARELIRSATLQEWDPVRRRVQRRRFVLLSGCLLKAMEVPSRQAAGGGGGGGVRSRWRRSSSGGGGGGSESAASSGNSSGEGAALMYCDSIDLYDISVGVVGWGMELGLQIRASSPQQQQPKQWDIYFETAEEAHDWASELQRQIAKGAERRQQQHQQADAAGGGGAVAYCCHARVSVTAPVLPPPFLLATTRAPPRGAE